MSIDQKQCRWLDYQMKLVYDPEYSAEETEPGCGCGCGCDCDCEPEVSDHGCKEIDVRNVKLVPVDAEPQYITLQGLTLVHIQTLDSTYDTHGIKVRVDRVLQCKNGCTPAGQLVHEGWFGSGTMLAAGEYEFSIPPQVVEIPGISGYCQDDLPIDAGLITLLFEPADKDQVTASIYNGNLKTCI